MNEFYPYIQGIHIHGVWRVKMLGQCSCKYPLILLATSLISHWTSLPDRSRMKSIHACKLPVTISSVQVASGRTNRASSFLAPLSSSCLYSSKLASKCCCTLGSSYGYIKTTSFSEQYRCDLCKKSRCLDLTNWWLQAREIPFTLNVACAKR